MTTELRKFRPLGWSEDADTCGLCGKAHLERVFAFEDAGTHEVVYFGSECMKKAAGFTAKSAEREIYEDRRRRENEYARRIENLPELKAIRDFKLSCGRYQAGKYRPLTTEESAILADLNAQFDAVAAPIAKELGL